jgi:hypothetical protein
VAVPLLVIIVLGFIGVQMGIIPAELVDSLLR